MRRLALVVLPFLVQLPLHPQHERRRRRHLDGLDRAVRRERRGHQAPAHVADRLMVVAVDVGALTEMIGQATSPARRRSDASGGRAGADRRGWLPPALAIPPTWRRDDRPAGGELVEVTEQRAAERDVRGSGTRGRCPGPAPPPPPPSARSRARSRPASTRVPAGPDGHRGGRIGRGRCRDRPPAPGRRLARSPRAGPADPRGTAAGRGTLLRPAPGADSPTP